MAGRSNEPWVWLANILGMILLAAVSWLMAQVYEINGSRCTDLQCSILGSRVSLLEAGVHEEVPPMWFLQKVEKLESRVDRLDRRIE